MKLQCIEDLALGQVKLLRADKARALLAGVEGQFQAEESRTKLTELRQRVDALSAQIRDDSKAKALASRVRARQMHLAELQRRLEAARRAGDREEVRRYERLLSNQ